MLVILVMLVYPGNAIHHYDIIMTSLLTLGTHAQRGSVGQISVCLSVCLSVTTLAKASLRSTLRRRYVQHWYTLFSVLRSWNFEKTFRSKVMEYLLTATSYCTDAANFDGFSGSFKVKQSIL